jgi:bifunctional DNase/RNase
MLCLKALRPDEETFMKSHRCLLFVLMVLFHAAAVYAAQTSPLVETKIKTLLIDPASQSPVVVLETITDKKLLPIWINVMEARAIATELEHVTLPRPLTHDLIRNILHELGASLQRVVITDLRNDTFFAQLFLRSKGQELQIDSRPSDAIAIALRMKAPIFATPELLAKTATQPALPDRGDRTPKRLGVQAQDLTPELANLLDSRQQRGALVTDVALGSIAMNAGIKRGDIITKANEQTVSSAKALESMIQGMKRPAQIKLEVIKKGKSTTVVIDLPS